MDRRDGEPERLRALVTGDMPELTTLAGSAAKDPR